MVYYYSTTKLLVNYIPSNFTKKDLFDLFSPIGLLKDHELLRINNENLGYGFVEYFNPYDAKIAVKKLDGLRIQDKTLKVDYSHFTKKGKLFINNLRRDATEDDVSKVFGSFGAISYIKIIKDNVASRMYGVKSGVSTGKVFVLYVNFSDAFRAYVNLNGTLTINNTYPLNIAIM